MQRTSRQLLIDQRTTVANSLRGRFDEFGVIERKVWHAPSLGSVEDRP
jgi:hypothetical protein